MFNIHSLEDLNQFILDCKLRIPPGANEFWLTVNPYQYKWEIYFFTEKPEEYYTLHDIGTWCGEIYYSDLMNEYYDYSVPKYTGGLPQVFRFKIKN